MLYRLSYASPMERETGIEPATNSLEGCDSTIELLPLAAHSIVRVLGREGQRIRPPPGRNSLPRSCFKEIESRTAPTVDNRQRLR
jgi:hypothetical protein